MALVGGFDFSVGPLPLRAHTYGNPLAVLAGLLFLRWQSSGTLPLGFGWLPRFLVVGTSPLALSAIGALAALLMVTPETMSGLRASCYDNPEWSGEPMWGGRTRSLSLTCDGRLPYARNFSIEWTGALHVPVEAAYRFSSASDDGSQVWIGDGLVVDNGGEHPAQTRDGVATLAEGFHPIRVRYTQRGGQALFTAAWHRVEEPEAEPPTEQPLSSAVLFPQEPHPLVFGLFRAGLDVLARRWTILALLLGAAVVRWRLRSGPAIALRTGSRSPGRVAFAVEIALAAALAWLFWLALAGSAGTWDVDALAERYAPALLVVASLLIVRRFTRGSVLGGFCLPPVVVAWTRTTFRRGAERWRSPGVRTATIVVAATVLLSAALVSLAAHWSSGLTGRYYDEPTWNGPLLATARDREINLRRTVYDFVNPDYRFSVDWEGAVYVHEAGDYQLATGSNGIVHAWVNEALIVAQGGGHAGGLDGVSRLDPGFHSLRIRFAPPPRGRGSFLPEWRRLSATRADSDRAALSHAWLFPQPPSAATFAVFRLDRTIRGIARVVLLSTLTVVWLVGCHWIMTARPRIDWRNVYIALLAAAAAGYLAAAYWAPPEFWGFNYLSRLPPGRVFAAFAIAGVVLAGYHQHPAWTARASANAERWLADHWWAVAAVAVLGIAVFFGLRSEFVNPDGVAFRWMVPQMALPGAGVNFDEMWESYLHSRIWYYTNLAFGWSVRLAFQVTSSIAGGLFLVLLWMYARRLVPEAALAFCALMASGGYMQLFFGDVENYTLVAVAILGYFIASLQFLQGSVPLVVPSAMMAVAMCFHMLAGFLLPSLAVLYLIALRRRAVHDIIIAAVIFGGVIIGSVLFVNVSFESEGSWGTKAIAELLGSGSQIATGGQVNDVRHWRPMAFDRYHWDVYNLLALMFPAHLLAIPLILGRRIPLDRINVHLIVASLSMLAFQFNYRAMLAVEDDWNLFATASIPVAILVWRNFLQARDLPYKPAIAIGWAAISFVHTSSWVLANHRFIP